jgi:hypothetical protein
MDLGTLYVSLGAGGGGILVALLGWFESKENFVARKFMPSIIRSVLAGIIFAVGYTVSGRAVTMADILIAVAAGAGIDAGLKRAVGAGQASNSKS